MKQTPQELKHAQLQLSIQNLGEKHVQLSELKDFLFWSKITTCKFYFTYAKNASNVRIGRAGALTVERYGTRNLKLVGASKRPKGARRPSTKLITYYDFKRNNWRCFRRNTFVVLTALYDFKDKRWVSVTDEAKMDKIYDAIVQTRVIGGKK